MSGIELEAIYAGGEPLVRVVVTCVLAYAGVVVLVRISGKRTLAQLNAFDWIVTVAFGSMLATTVLTDEIPLANGLAAFVTLAALQYVVTFASSRARPVERLLKNEPALLVHRGELLPGAMRRERITEEEIRQAIRTEGAGSLADVGAVVLETSGELSILGADQEAPDALRDLVPPDDGSRHG